MSPTPTPITIDATGCMIDIKHASRLIDEAVAAGHKRADLRWRIGVTQRRMLRRMLLGIAPLETLRREIECGGGEETGMFAGLFYIVDQSIRGDGIIPEVIRETERIGMIHGLMVDYSAEGV